MTRGWPEQVEHFSARYLFSRTIFDLWCQTGFSSTNPRQSHRVHPVHAAEEPYPPARHWRPEEAERAVGAAGWVRLIFLVSPVSIHTLCERESDLFAFRLPAAVRALEKAKGNGQIQTNYSSDSSLYTNRKGSAVSAFDGGSDSSSESEPDELPNRKKLRVEPS